MVRAMAAPRHLLELVDACAALVDARDRCVQAAVVGGPLTPALLATVAALANAPQAVPSLARAHGLPRQVVQRRLNTLRAADLAAPVPESGRSPTYALTAAGQAELARVALAVEAALAVAAGSLKKGALRDAARLVARAADRVGGGGEAGLEESDTEGVDDET